MGDAGDVRARLERQAAEILGRARAEAAAVLQAANAAADELLTAARREAERLKLDGVAERDAARREVQVAQEQAIRIRTDAQRTADSIIERAKRRARTEADELLREARLQLAKAVADVQDARRTADDIRAKAARERIVIDITKPEVVVDLTGDPGAVHEPVRLLPPATEVAQAGAVAEAVAVVAGPMTADELRAWVSDLSDATLDELIAGAVACAVHKAVGPTIVRAGRYTITQPLV